MDLRLDSTTQATPTSGYGFARGADGDVAFDDTEAHAVVSSALEERGSWWADPSHGSALFTLRNLNAQAPSQAEAMTLEAEQPLVDAGAILTSTAAAKRAAGGRLAVDLRWTTPRGAAPSSTILV
jgi:phage gp46-like protein